ncbi:YadA-like family protein [Lonepinella sp. BR2271]|uniref:YadA-like family protein n=1 Tax=Lonepinella sp. BR2271 TaxID=3434550 RepID=UPI003F6DCAB2
MNRIFKVFWNHRLQRFIISSEFGKAHGKGRVSQHKILRLISTALTGMIATVAVLATSTALAAGTDDPEVNKENNIILAAREQSISDANNSVKSCMGDNSQVYQITLQDSICLAQKSADSTTQSTTSASEAKESATKASDAANQAKESENNAVAAADQAKESAETALQHAEQAKQSAQTAEDSANQAQLSSESAVLSAKESERLRQLAHEEAERAKNYGCRSEADGGGKDSTACGNNASASGVAATAIGQGATASAENSVALGANSVANQANTVSVGNAGKARRVTHVADGVNPTDAINKRQLDRVEKEYRAGIAGVAALAGVPQVIRPDASMLGMGVGNYKNADAVAIGYSRASANNKIIFKVNTSINNRGDMVSNAGIGYQY